MNELEHNWPPLFPNAQQAQFSLSMICGRRLEHTNKYDAAHDDQHDRGEIASAALAFFYAAQEMQSAIAKGVAPIHWPFEPESWKPRPTPMENLIEAAALIAAEIDRLNRKREA